ncbi:hypothetical protein [Mucilaginibacter ginkgonis]|uniref:Uncharacterized protein n=1 Tax=Mucilaginibacter ginkgonis TaxID=2682091 RepID=A0A6I4IMH1_9SPHI|nr:hypothetical protein [Mucilaginibacter ginkgonis]QQL50339.1 hypothetical protein GO620_002470 [Mucilaginibacter ginkgonis]
MRVNIALNAATKFISTFGLILLTVIYLFGCRYTNSKKIENVENLKRGMKIYLSNKILADTGNKTYYLLQLIRPITNSDIDTMNLELSKKSLMDKYLNTSNKPYLVVSNLIINCDSLRKHRGSAIGIYLGTEKLDIKVNEISHYRNFFNIKLNHGPFLETIEGESEIPDGYILEKGHYYIVPSDTTI